LHIWQYPKQLAGYLTWLVDVAPGMNAYLEIGSRWGGMFILIAEWLRHNGANLHSVIAVDPITPTPFIQAYYRFLMQDKQDGRSPPELMYSQFLSTSAQVNQLVDRIKPDFVFVDGDHRLAGALADHMMARKYARVVVHHDIHSQACPDTTFLWSVLKTLEAPLFEAVEFIEQYDSVPGSFLGIGALRRRANA
jgi:cephalosporin hydroxylase